MNVENTGPSTDLVKTSDASTKVSTPEQIVLTPPPVSNFKTFQDHGTSNMFISSTHDTSTIETSLSLPSLVSTTPIVTHSPTFDNILNQHITSLFSSQYTDPPITNEEEEAHNDDENEFDGTLANIEFDSEEENILDNMLLTGKQFKILNRKLNSLLQIQVDGGDKHFVSSLEVDILLKGRENRLHEAISSVDRNKEKQVKE
ncbi:unnamed protein product [Lactuca saligna]|uniref:Uncharacterized protein n=1 Tax=Lactuca saligna TaxID=75948 RepID=A0AA35VPX1_LACSI|nr:unnamed protein product [Lactuca saligna]